MDGVHDMGGMHGFGPVPEDDAQFHAEWERAVYGMDKIAKAEGTFNIDEKRHAIERMDPAEYLGSTYFERWLDGLERLLVEKGHVTEAELEAARERVADAEDPEAIVPEREDEALVRAVREAFAADSDFEREGPDPSFEPGDPVRVRNDHPAGHTRSPRYVRRAEGEVVSVHGTHVLPDASAHGEERAEPLYSVRFDAAELWGPDREADDAVHVDLWESYLEEP
ncbi:MAG: nitrile hydratase subunit beta [Haloarculaceae archaeon]